MAKKLFTIAAVCLAALAGNNIYASYAECANGNDPKDGPPWDPCKYFESKDNIPKTAAGAKQYMPVAKQRIKQIHHQDLSLIDSLTYMGFLGNGATRYNNSVALEFLVWQSGYRSPIAGRFYPHYKMSNFYHAGNNDDFKYFLPPFDYLKGWKNCQALAYKAKPQEVREAQKLIDQFKGLMYVLTMEYKPGDPDKETAKEIIDRQNKFNDAIIQRVKDFNLDASLAYAKSQLNQYVRQQTKYHFGVKMYLNAGCLKATYGTLIQFQN